MEQLKNTNLFNMKETIAADIFKDTTYPWEVLSKIGNFILTLGSTLSLDEYEKKGRSNNPWRCRIELLWRRT